MRKLPGLKTDAVDDSVALYFNRMHDDFMPFRCYHL